LVLLPKNRIKYVLMRVGFAISTGIHNYAEGELLGELAHMVAIFQSSFFLIK
jgi:hypothetical protein